MGYRAVLPPLDRTPNYLVTHNDDCTHSTGKLPSWTVCNGSVTYNPIKNLGLSLLVKNVFNKIPPMDHSYPGSTGTSFNVSNYNVYGHAMYIEANYKFGAGAN